MPALHGHSILEEPCVEALDHNDRLVAWGVLVMRAARGGERDAEPLLEAVGHRSEDPLDDFLGWAQVHTQQRKSLTDKSAARGELNCDSQRAMLVA